MDTVVWIVVGVLCVVGLLGTLLPLLPGTGLILAATLVFRVWFGPESIGWLSLSIIALLFLLSIGVDFVAGVTGARLSGASRSGLVGGGIGLVIGLFFGLPGLLLGPLAGVLAGELLAGRRLSEAGRSSLGTVLGNLVGSLAKFAIALAMVGVLAIAIWR